MANTFTQDLSTNSKPLPGLILRLLKLTPIRQVGVGINDMAFPSRSDRGGYSCSTLSEFK